MHLILETWRYFIIDSDNGLVQNRLQAISWSSDDSICWCRYASPSKVSWQINSLAPGRPGCHFKTAISNFILLIGNFTSSKDNARRWMPRDIIDDKSTLFQVMAWCRQATSHYLSQCWPSSMSPYVFNRPQWVNIDGLVLWSSIFLALTHWCKGKVVHLKMLFLCSAFLMV